MPFTTRSCSLAAVTLATLASLSPAAAVTINSYPATAVNVRVNTDAPGVIDTLMPGTNVSASLQQYYQNTLNNTLKIPGGALYVTTPQGELAMSFGSDTLESYQPFSLENHFRVGSLTKTMVATAVLKLISEGKVSLTDTWAKYYNGSQGDFPYADQITVRDLLGMTSGMYNYVRSMTALQIQATDPTTPFSYEQIIQVILQGQPYGAPKDFQQTANYTNSNYILLGHIIENVTGTSDADYVSENCWKPIGIDVDTTWPMDAYEFQSPHGEGYGPWPLTSTTEYGNKTYSNPTQALSAGAVISNLKSLKAWVEYTVSGQAYGGPTSELHGERTKGYIHPLGQPLPLDVTFEYGLGLMKLNDYYGHDGSISGFTTMAFTNPAKNITLVAVGNTGPTGVTAKNAVEMLAMIDPDFLKPTNEIPGVPGQTDGGAAEQSASASAAANANTAGIGAAAAAAPTAGTPAGAASKAASPATTAVGALSAIFALVGGQLLLD